MATSQATARSTAPTLAHAVAPALASAISLTLALSAAWALLTQPARAAPACVAPRQVVERFVPADCERCWAEPAAAAQAPSTWVLDWIVPVGPEAALSAAALPEATERLAALGLTTPAGATRAVEVALPRSALRMQIEGGPAWNGYLGLALNTRGKPPAGAQAYVALVEVLPAGQEGSAVERRLLRAVAGPLPLNASGERDSQLRALRLPEGAQPERLQGMAWWVDSRGRLGGIAREACPVR